MLQEADKVESQEGANLLPQPSRNAISKYSALII